MNNSLSTKPILELDNLVKRFGGVVAVSNVSFNVKEGQIQAVIGPNGAGKTTLFNLITGVDFPNEGEIRFKGAKISGLKPHEIAYKGISRTFQSVQLFSNMSVLENVMIGRHLRSSAGLLSTALRLPFVKREEKLITEDAMKWLNFVGLDEEPEGLASNLAFGQQRSLEFARALATEPELLLLDEPAAGLNISETEAISELIQRIRELGITVLLVEHDMSLVMNISDEVVVLNYGELIAEGIPHEIQNNPDVIAAYLGDVEQTVSLPKEEAETELG